MIIIPTSEYFVIKAPVSSPTKGYQYPTAVLFPCCGPHCAARMGFWEEDIEWRSAMMSTNLDLFSPEGKN